MALIFATKWIHRSNQIDACCDRGARLNYEMNGLEEYNQPNIENLTDFYWKSVYDSVNHKEFLSKGRLVDSLERSPTGLINILNKRNVLPKIKFLDIQSDTILILIDNDQYLTEQMGTTGAYSYLGETVFTLTENDSIRFVKIEMDVGSHANPGVYSRTDFSDLIN